MVNLNVEEPVENGDISIRIDLIFMPDDVVCITVTPIDEMSESFNCTGTCSLLA